MLLASGLKHGLTALNPKSRTEPRHITCKEAEGMIVFAAHGSPTFPIPVPESLA